MITITKEEFQAATGYNLSYELSDRDDNTEQKVLRTIKLWTIRVYQKMTVSQDKTDFTDIQIATIKQAIIDYGMYYLKNGDLYYQSGYSEIGGQSTSRSEIDKAKFPAFIIDNLQSVGLIRRTFGRYGGYPI